MQELADRQLSQLAQIESQRQEMENTPPEDASARLHLQMEADSAENGLAMDRVNLSKATAEAAIDALEA